MRECLGELKLVRIAHEERRFLLEKQKHLTYWLPIATPVRSWLLSPAPFGHPLFAVAPAFLPLMFKFYDYLGDFRSPSSYTMSRKQALLTFPTLDDRGLKFCSVFYEGAHDDARTNVAIALTAIEKGACCLNHTEMTQVLFDDHHGAKKASGVRVRSAEGAYVDVRAKRVVFAGGPFTDQLREASSSTEKKEAISAAAGSHVVFRERHTPKDMGLLDVSTTDGRFLFVVPWQGHTLVGTTDVKESPSSSAKAPFEEVQWLTKEAATHVVSFRGEKKLKATSTWRGYRPLATNPFLAEGRHRASRDHVVCEDPETGVLLVAGGKWTTYRRMAQDVVDLLDPPLKEATTLDTFLVGAGYDTVDALLADLRREKTTANDDDLLRRLASTYGVQAFYILRNYKHLLTRLHANFPVAQAEVAYACDSEYAQTVTDVLTARTRIAYLDADAARNIAPKVADIMAHSLNWTDHHKQQQLRDALEAINDYQPPSSSS